MRSSLLLLACVAVLLAASPSLAEDPAPPAKAEPAAPKKPAAAEPALPKAWHGIWKGRCKTGNPSGKSIEFAMELHVAPIPEREAWTWTIIYGEGPRRQVRPYELLAVAGRTGHFRVDEKNTIVIDSYLQGDTLYSRFEVAGNSIDARYTLRGKALDVSLVTTKSGPVSTTGGKGKVPPVKSFELIGIQGGTLTR